MAGVVVVICILLALTWFIVRRIRLARRSRGDTTSGLGSIGVVGGERGVMPNADATSEGSKGDEQMRPPDYKP